MLKAQQTKSSVQEQLDAVKVTPRRQAPGSLSYNFDSQKKVSIKEQASEVDAEQSRRKAPQSMAKRREPQD